MVQRASSVASRGSGYRTVARTSEVDESLFGNTKPGAKVKNPRNRDVMKVHDTVTLPKLGSRSMMPEAEVVTLSRGDLQRMMGASPIMTAAQASDLKKQVQEKKEQERAHSNARKAKMLAMEAERRKQVPPTETELLKQQADAATLTHAEKLLAEQQDEVKHMNQMMLYSKCVTIRDAQLEERKHMMLEEEDENRRLDMVMEIERLKALENYEERERQRKAERLIGAKVLQEQLEERKRARIRAEEMQERERIIMLKEMDRLREAELRAQVEKQLKARALVAEVMAANDEQIERKKEMQQRELEEEARIADYNRLKALREESIAEEKDRIAKEKEAEIAKMRAAQEKAADKQSELDELRARRYAETAEREWRVKEAAKAAREQAILTDLHQSRQAQQAAKVVQQAEMAAREKNEFEHILAVNSEKEAQDMKFTAQMETLRKQHQHELLAQIAANEEKRKINRQNYLEEGRSVRKGASDYLAKLEAIKRAKLAELKAAGVPDKYCAELARYKVGQSGH